MRIAIVNDLTLAREVLRRVVLSVPGHVVAWEAADGEEAASKAAADRPDAILMDLVMPKVNGVEATRAIMQRSPCPVVVVTATIPGNYELVMRAMGAGAIDAVETPVLSAGGVVQKAEPLLARLAKLVAAGKGVPGSGYAPAHRLRLTADDPDKPLTPKALHLPPLVLVGSSTGGPDALATVLGALPAGFPAWVLVAQHIAADFATGLVSWLGERCKLPVRAAKDGDPPAAGVVQVAVSNDHLELTPDLVLRYTASPRSWPYRPSADVLFASAAAVWPRRGLAVLLTGMGPDGADGLLRLRAAGWHTIAQDEATSVVYGMPKVAAEKGAAVEVLPLPRIGPTLTSRLMAPR
jgi:two-component system response regulator WspF